MAIPTPSDQPTLSVEEAGRAYGLSRATAYRACHDYIRTDGAEGIPALRIGTRIVCPTAAVRRHLGIDESAA